MGVRLLEFMFGATSRGLGYKVLALGFRVKV